MCVRVCVRARVRWCDMRGTRYYLYRLILEFFVYIIVDLVKRCMLTFGTETRSYKVD